ncbi:MAG TPA: N(4)-(beta-N-acetylglucosaminyl)-L-asparaginase [Gemmatimonadales bacterium]|mgnify:CR=1 FL=1|nr:N(4)-(beta-N-acetylglucosaminyl)-L-asparaginase [Gemmatimonadales bacterium]
MSDAPLSRRSFLGTAGAVVAGSALASRDAVAAPAILRSRFATPVAIASSNGLRGVEKAVQMVLQGADTLDAGVEGVKIQELDPRDQSVGYGGLPNEEGVVQLDASCMHGPTKRAGAVGALEGIKTPSEVARLVMKYTPHILLVGKDAQRFALSYGFKLEELLTPESREAWLKWRAARGANDNWLNPKPGERMQHTTGTINMNVVNAAGDISSVTTTSGLAWKVPGRCGDSPIVGAGQYTDNSVGAAGSTGLGEANIMVCGGFLTVEHMRQGMSPTDAALATLKRVVALTPPALLDERGRPTYQIQFYAVNKKGQYGAAAMTASPFAVCDEKGARIEQCATLYS